VLGGSDRGPQCNRAINQSTPANLNIKKIIGQNLILGMDFRGLLFHSCHVSFSFFVCEYFEKQYYHKRHKHWIYCAKLENHRIDDVLLSKTSSYCLSPNSSETLLPHLHSMNTNRLFSL
jgi:hypothetical protein